MVPSKFLVAALICASSLWLFISVKPIDRFRFDVVPAKLSAKPRVQAIVRFLHSKDQPDIVFVGSSLILVASIAADATVDSTVPASMAGGLFEKLQKTDAIYAAKCVGDKLGQSVHVRDLGIPAAMCSDYKLLVSKLVQFGKHPRLLLIAIAPRDFCDNLYKDATDTTSYEMLVRCIPTSAKISLQNFITFLDNSDFGLSEMIDGVVDAARIRLFTMRFYCDRHLRDFVLTILNRSTAPTIAGIGSVCDGQAAQAKPRTAPSPPKPKYIDLSAYAFSYNPPDFGEFDQNFASLETTIKVCQHEKIPVTLLNMPISQENKELIPRALYDRYKSSLTRLQRENGIVVIQPETLTKFGSDDFEDSAHLRCQGSQKLFLTISGVLADMIRKMPAVSGSR